MVKDVPFSLIWGIYKMYDSDITTACILDFEHAKCESKHDTVVYISALYQYWCKGMHHQNIWYTLIYTLVSDMIQIWKYEIWKLLEQSFTK